ncbi:MAG: Sulfur carrier protein CysO [Gemmatimonadaceae bacterium]|nr:Sulfur carrier protein CysO [Gemmatimonadaceae bacterium]
MAITIHLPTVLAPFAQGERVLEVSSGTVGAAVQDIGTRFPSLLPRLADSSGQPYAFVTFYVNDEDVRFLDGFNTPIADGDEVTIVPAVAGG